MIKFIYNFQTIDKYFKDRITLYMRFKWHVGRAVRNLTILALFVTTGAVSAYVYNYLHPVTVWAEKTVEVPVETNSPVLNRIAKCESGDTQYKNGQVLIRPNTNGSVDIGRYQINSIWNAQATKLGLDLTKEKDNETFARWLYANKGTGDWSASSSCWNK